MGHNFCWWSRSQTCQTGHSFQGSRKISTQIDSRLQRPFLPSDRESSIYRLFIGLTYQVHEISTRPRISRDSFDLFHEKNLFRRNRNLGFGPWGNNGRSRWFGFKRSLDDNGFLRRSLGCVGTSRRWNGQFFRADLYSVHVLGFEGRKG